jgi:indole-3-glycerol phosphate synthase
MDKLAEIIAWKRREIASILRPVSEAELARLAAARPAPAPFIAPLAVPGELKVIAEIKRRSPSAGAIAEISSAADQARRYRDAGADALSILTDSRYFGGSIHDLAAVTHFFKEAPAALPCLRKDFMVHPIQVAEAVEAGASAILIIVRALNDEEIRRLFGAASAAGLDALFEIHDEPDLERALSAGARLIGVNNRDLALFRTDLALSERLIPQIPLEIPAVSESGIFTAADAARVRQAGARAILVGEALMKAPDPADLIGRFKHP